MGIFTGLRGNVEGGLALLHFIESLQERTWRAAGYELWFYPLCNPTGHEDARETSRRDTLLHGDFWRDSVEPEIMLLERELSAQAFHGVIVLYTDDSGRGIFTGSSFGSYAWRLTEFGAGRVPLHPRYRSRGTAVATGGPLGSPPGHQHQTFSMRLGTPKEVPMQVRIAALDAALGAVLASARHYVNLDRK